MKKIFSAVIPMLFCASVFATPRILSSPVDHLFIPSGFDDNDNVEVLVSGSFPTDCYARNKVEAKVKGDQIQIQITALVSTPDKPCEALTIPFLENVTLGNLPSGTYRVTVNGKLRDKLQVKEARSLNVDDYLYAMVDYVELGFTGGLGGEVLLVGRTPDCLAFDRVEILSNGKDTFSVLPRMKRVSTTCSQKRSPFQIPVKFQPNALKHHKVLLFVRTMDGKSIHAIIEK